MLKHFSKRVQFDKGNVIAKTYSHFKYVITLHVVAMNRTKNTAKSNPFVLCQATLADHIQAIAVSIDVEKDPETKETGVTSPQEWMGLNLKMLKLLNVQKLFQQRVSQSP